MATPGQQLQLIKNFEDLVVYLQDELDWPLQDYGYDDLTFEYSPAELGLKDEDAVKVRDIRQLRPLQDGQPWGIFFVEFERKKLPVVVLRRILSHLVVKKRTAADKAHAATWAASDILFISAFGDEGSVTREIAFAHFHQEEGDLPTLRVLGWDGGDTPLKMDYVQKVLADRLRWPDDSANVDAWRRSWSSIFRHKPGHVIKTADQLAEALAALARRIRYAALTLLGHETERGTLRSLHKAFQTSLIHDLSETDFADTYAQTITYGLLTAAISRTEMSEGRYGTALTAGDVTAMVPITNPFLREMLQTFLRAGGQKGGIDFDELGIQDVVELLRGEETDLPAILLDFGNKTQGEDPVIHFYEHFLAAYDIDLKIQRGVFYTPKAVVSCIVRSVDEVLRSEFGITDGLASTITWGEMAKRTPGLTIPKDAQADDPFVVVLDPATGTGTFLVEVVDVIFATMTTNWKARGMNEAQRQSAWNSYVISDLFPRLFGYELMMAPYAIAHMRLPLKLKETGFTAWDGLANSDRFHVYLTNALNTSPDSQKALEGVLPALANEARVVSTVKNHMKFTVVIGNPPYSGLSANMGASASSLIDRYKFISGVHFGERKHWLHDDYVKFVSLAEGILKDSRCGVLGFITNHAFYDNPTFRGMRWNLLETFQRLYFLDLHGNTMKRERNPLGGEDKNVFDIQQGVAISVFAKLTGKAEQSVKYGELWGDRESKYRLLSDSLMSNLSTKLIEPEKPFYWFDQRDSTLKDEYVKWQSVSDIFRVYSGGFITARDHFVVDFDYAELAKRIDVFIDESIDDESIRRMFFSGMGSSKYPDGDTRGWKLSSARSRARSDPFRTKRIRRCLYRPFDLRWVYWVDWMVDWPRPEVNSQLINHENLGFVFMRQAATGDEYSHFYVSRTPVDNRACYSNKGIMSLAPLFLFPEMAQSQDLIATESNIHPSFLDALGIRISKETQTVSVSDIEFAMNFIYAIGNSPQYRSRYATFLKSDFPRIPSTPNSKLSRSLSILGQQLIALHLVEFGLTDGDNVDRDWPIYTRLAHFTGANRIVDKIATAEKAWQSGRVAVNATSGFEGVPEDVWNLSVGGYQVCHKWLKDRKGRTLTDEDILHYCKIVTALHETIRIMDEIDAVIEEHGGWPGAFAGE